MRSALDALESFVRRMAPKANSDPAVQIPMIDTETNAVKKI
jgi:hypothetical protein